MVKRKLKSSKQTQNNKTDKIKCLRRFIRDIYKTLSNEDQDTASYLMSLVTFSGTETMKYNDETKERILNLLSKLKDEFKNKCYTTLAKESKEDNFKTLETTRLQFKICGDFTLTIEISVVTTNNGKQFLEFKSWKKY